MGTVLRVIAKAVAYGIVGGSGGAVLGGLINSAVSFVQGLPGDTTLGEGVWIGAVMGVATGVVMSDPLEQLCWPPWGERLLADRRPERSKGADGEDSPTDPVDVGKGPRRASQLGMTTRKRVVLFLCTGNSARSQMAEAFLKKYAGDRFEIHSAGMEPRGIHPLTTRVMSEVGIDISGQQSKGLRQFLGRLTVHLAIIVCQNVEKNCPTLWPGALARMEWPFEDPAACEGSEEERLRKFRSVREQIEARIKRWLVETPGDG
jgi:arsenate reductase